MVTAVLVCLYHIHQKFCQIVSISRGSDLIIYHAQFIMCLGKIQHSFNKVLSIHSEYPGDSDDIILLQIFFYCQFSFVFRLSIDIQRLSFIIRLPWSGAFSVKYVICTDIDHFQIQLFADLCNIFCPLRIDLMTEFRIVFCCIYCGISCTVNHRFHFRLLDDLLYFCCIGDIHLFYVYTDSGMPAFGEFVHYIIAKLAFYTCN